MSVDTQAKPLSFICHSNVRAKFFGQMVKRVSPEAFVKFI